MGCEDKLADTQIPDRPVDDEGAAVTVPEIVPPGDSEASVVVVAATLTDIFPITCAA